MYKVYQLVVIQRNRHTSMEFNYEPTEKEIEDFLISTGSYECELKIIYRV